MVSETWTPQLTFLGAASPLMLGGFLSNCFLLFLTTSESSGWKVYASG